MKRGIEMNRRKSGSFLRCLTLLVIFTAPVTFARNEPEYLNAESHETRTSLRQSRPAKNLNDLINRLKTRGRKVLPGGKVSQPFFSVGGRIITADGEQVQAFQYASAKAAEREAKAVDSQGSAVGTSMPMWVGPPHFYKSGRLIVLYVGQSSSLIEALNRALGPQFAGK